MPKILKILFRLEKNMKKPSNELFSKNFHSPSFFNGYLPNEICFHKFIQRNDLCQITMYNQNKSIDIKNIKLIMRILKRIKIMNKNITEKPGSSISKVKHLIEWKEAAAKLDNIFLVISMLTVTLTPAIMFEKYIFEVSGLLPCRCLES